MIAHQGGWDEILLVLGPILLIVGLLRLAKSRVTRQPPTTGHTAPDSTGPDQTGPGDPAPGDSGP